MATFNPIPEVETTEDTEDTEEPRERIFCPGQFLAAGSVIQAFSFPCAPCLPWFPEPIRKFVCGSEVREKKAHEQDEDGKDGTGSC